MESLIILEPTDTGYSTDSPDLDGCVAAGDNRQQTIELISATIAFHFSTGLRQVGIRGKLARIDPEARSQLLSPVGWRIERQG